MLPGARGPVLWLVQGWYRPGGLWHEARQADATATDLLLHIPETAPPVVVFAAASDAHLVLATKHALVVAHTDTSGGACLSMLVDVSNEYAAAVEATSRREDEG